MQNVMIGKGQSLDKKLAYGVGVFADASSEVRVSTPR
jgi:hypothetical protein